MNLVPLCFIPLLLILLLAFRFTLAEGTKNGNENKEVPEVPHGHKVGEVPNAEELSEVPNDIEDAEVPNGIENSGVPDAEEQTGLHNHHKKVSEDSNGIKKVHEVLHGHKVSEVPNAQKVPNGCNYKKAMVTETMFVTEANGHKKEIKLSRSNNFIAYGASGRVSLISFGIFI
jgi:hypothetical protein